MTTDFRTPLLGDIAQLGSLGSSPVNISGGTISPLQTTEIGPSTGSGLGNLSQSNPFRLADLEGTDIGRRTIFEQARPDFLRTGQQRDVFSSMFDRVLQDFLGEIGRDFRVGRPPSTNFTDFVNNRDFEREVRREGTGRGQSGLVSAARFLFDR